MLTPFFTCMEQFIIKTQPFTSLPLLQETAATCEPARDSAHYDIITNNQSIAPYLSTLIPSPLNLPIYEEEISSVPDRICPGRHLHTTVYDPHSDSLWIFGGRESSGRLCDAGLALVNLSLVLAGLENDSDEIGEEGEGLVRWVVSSGSAPSGRLFHAAALLPVSEYTNSTLIFFLPLAQTKRKKKKPCPHSQALPAFNVTSRKAEALGKGYYCQL